MALSGQKIAIIGAGIGGLAAALVLAQRGAEVIVFEQAQEISEVGAGLQIGPNGARILKALGLEEALLRHGVRGEAVQLRNYRHGEAVLDLDLGLLPADQPYYFLHRADLIQILADAVRRAGVKVRLLQKVDRIEDGPKPKVIFSNKAEYCADMILGADGVHSKVRPTLNGAEDPEFTHQVAWRATIPNDLNHPNVAMVHMGPKRHLVSYPLRGASMINIVAVQERAKWAQEGWHHADDPANLRAVFSDFGGMVPQMLSQVEEVKLWGLFKHPVAGKWHGARVAILGDAAHPTLPFMAQGAVMALEDAWVLGDALDRAQDLGEGLAAYQRRREDRARAIVDAATGNAWKYHLSFKPLRFAAHSALRLGGRVMPRRMLSQFDWIYLYDVTREAG